MSNMVNGVSSPRPVRNSVPIEDKKLFVKDVLKHLETKLNRIISEPVAHFESLTTFLPQLMALIDSGEPTFAATATVIQDSLSTTVPIQGDGVATVLPIAAPFNVSPPG